MNISFKKHWAPHDLLTSIPKYSKTNTHRISTQIFQCFSSLPSNVHKKKKLDLHFPPVFSTFSPRISLPPFFRPKESSFSRPLLVWLSTQLATMQGNSSSLILTTWSALKMLDLSWIYHGFIRSSWWSNGGLLPINVGLLPIDVGWTIATIIFQNLIFQPILQLN